MIPNASPKRTGSPSPWPSRLLSPDLPQQTWWRGVLYPIAFVGLIHGRANHGWTIVPEWLLLGPGWCALASIAVLEFCTFFAPTPPVDSLRRLALVACVIACIFRPLDELADWLRWSSEKSVLDDFDEQFEPVRLILLAVCSVLLLFGTWLLPHKVLARVQSALALPTLVVLATWPR